MSKRLSRDWMNNQKRFAKKLRSTPRSMENHASKKSPSAGITRTKKKREQKMPERSDYEDAFAQVSDLVLLYTETMEGAMVVIKPSRRRGGWVVRTAVLGFEKKPPKSDIDLIKSICGDEDQERWEDWGLQPS